MNTTLCVLAGAILGWVGFSMLELNHGGGRMFSVILGAMGGVVGVKLVAPVFVSATEVPGAFSLASVLIAIAVAAALLFVGSVLYRRWGTS